MASNLKVARAWAAQSKDRMRTSNGNMSFIGATLYSYNTPIANLIDAPNGQRVALHWAHDYSVTTTGKHRDAMLKALNYANEFQVPTIGVSGGRKLLSEVDHNINQNYIISRINTEGDRIARARVYKDEAHLNRLKETLANYKKTFNLA